MYGAIPNGGKSKKEFGRKHDIILRYSKSKEFVFNAKDVGIPMTPHKQDGKGANYGGKMGLDKNGRAYVEKQGTKDASGKYRYYRYYLDDGKTPEDWWVDINSIQSAAKERTGFPTQKPLSLYERMIRASSDEDTIVLDPFAGCATTLVAAERLGRQWVGIDIWDKAPGVVIERLNREGLFKPKRTKRSSKEQQGLLFAEDFHFTSVVPSRTDDEETASPFLRVKVSIKEPEGKKMSRKEMYEHLLDQHGMRCQGCDRKFDDSRYLELDHNTPRADGSINHISNRILLCAPCNRAKSHTYTLSGLRKLNKKNGWMTKS